MAHTLVTLVTTSSGTLMRITDLQNPNTITKSTPQSISKSEALLFDVISAEDGKDTGAGCTADNAEP